MKIFKFILGLLIVLLSIGAFAQEPINENNCLNGDVVFIKKTNFTSVHGAEKSKYNFTGVIFWENGSPMVYFASEPLSKTPLEEFIKNSEGGRFHIKRLADASQMDNETIGTMKTFATAKLGTAYDQKEALNNEEFYNAEFVWTLFKTCVGLYLCEAKDNATATTDKKQTLSFSDKHVSVKDLYRSELLQ